MQQKSLMTLKGLAADAQKCKFRNLKPMLRGYGVGMAGDLGLDFKNMSSDQVNLLRIR